MMKKTLWVGLLSLLPGLALAVADFAKTPQEEKLCQAMISGRDTSDRDWGHMHHYCDCIRFTSRAHSAFGNWDDMRYNLQVGIGGCDYVLQHTKSDFFMRPEVYLQKGKALRLYRQEGKAAAAFMEAIKGDPKLAQAYVELADYQARNKQHLEALKTVTEGLRHAPDSKPLKRRYTELGGKLPYPAPIEPAPVETPAAKPDEAVAPTPTPTPASPAEPATDRPTTVAPVAEPVASHKIGAPKNPYCRFCPD